jgi:NADPH-dependent curcumin reductase CurA
MDYVKQFPAALKDLAKWLQEGKIKRKVYIIRGGIEAAPQGLVDMYAGANTGKTLVEVAPMTEAIHNTKAVL